MLRLSEKRTRTLLYQGLLIAFILAFFYIACVNVNNNLAAAGIHIDYGFLFSESGFDVNESLIEYSSESSYINALLVGFLNTILLSFVCIVGATLLGVMFGVLRASQNWLGSSISFLYIELMRNLPKLLILLTLYILIINSLPHVREAYPFLGVFHISNRALYFPTLIWQEHTSTVLYSCLASLVIVLIYRRYVRYFKDETGRDLPFLWPSLLFLGFVFVLVSTLLGVHYSFDIPALKGFNFAGGGQISVQFFVLAFTLSVYHGGQVAELVRGGIQSISKGQEEAARAIGLSYLQTMRLVVLPQALRVIIPPIGNQYLNITKNTSIGLAVGFSDLVSVMNTSINQTFRPIEMMSVTTLIYLAICLVVSVLINAYNNHTRLEKA
ncbi:ABC transporter permease subunit [Marinomonas sp. 5E14-1]|uniref:amino acid ABC transporter permease n=1 Tax=Marinomonas sp. 5E14-1 TaxID=3153922 RepID=UPI0032656063